MNFIPETNNGVSEVLGGTAIEEISGNTISSFYNHIPWPVVGGILMIVLLVIIGFYMYQTYVEAPKKKYNPNNEYGSDSSSEGVDMCLFFVDWCPHCKVARKEWDGIKEDYNNKVVNGYTVSFKEYDCTSETGDFLDKNNITGYPTIKMLKNGEWIEYQARPSRNTLEEFIKVATQG